MKNILLMAIAAALSAAPAASAGVALSGLTGAEGLVQVPVAVSAPAPLAADADKAYNPWAEAVKKSYIQNLQNGKLFSLPVARNSELPAAALRQLERDNKGKSPKVSTAYKLVVSNRTAFVVHNKRDGRNITVHIYDASGTLVALGQQYHGGYFNWVNIEASPSADYGDYGDTGSGPHGGFCGNGECDDGLGGHGGNHGGPDDASDPDFGGWGGNSGGPDDTNYGGI